MKKARLRQLAKKNFLLEDGTPSFLLWFSLGCLFNEQKVKIITNTLVARLTFYSSICPSPQFICLYQ